jgi:hypothetical protein
VLPCSPAAPRTMALAVTELEEAQLADLNLDTLQLPQLR